jgi:hypothetical protein
MEPIGMSTKAARVLISELRGSFSHTWIGVWHRHILSKLADHAYEHINFERGTTRPRFLELDDPMKRTALVPSDAATEACIQLLLRAKRRLDSILERNIIPKLTKPKLEALLKDGNIVDTLIQSPTSNLVMTTTKT